MAPKPRVFNVRVVDPRSLGAYDAVLQHGDLADFAQFAPLLPPLRTAILCMASRGMLPTDLLWHVARHFHPLACCFRIAGATVATLQQGIGDRIGLRPHEFRLWLFSRRGNNTYRPDMPLLPVGVSSDTSLVLALFLEMKLLVVLHNGGNIDLFVETPCPRRPGEGAGALLPLSKDRVLLLFKFYEPATATLRYVGQSLVPRDETLAGLPALVNRLVHRCPAAPLLVYEEVAPRLIDLVDVGATADQLGLIDGDILIFQPPGPACGPPPPFPTACDLFLHIHRRVLVTFARWGARGGPCFTLDLLLDDAVDVARAKVAARLPAAPRARRVQLRGFRGGPSFGPTLGTVRAMLETLPAFVREISRTVSQVVLYEEELWDAEQHLALMESRYHRAYVDLKCVYWQAMACRLLDRYRRGRTSRGPRVVGGPMTPERAPTRPERAAQDPPLTPQRPSSNEGVGAPRAHRVRTVATISGRPLVHKMRPPKQPIEPWKSVVASATPVFRGSTLLDFAHAFAQDLT